MDQQKTFRKAHTGESKKATGKNIYGKKWGKTGGQFERAGSWRSAEFIEFFNIFLPSSYILISLRHFST